MNLRNASVMLLAILISSCGTDVSQSDSKLASEELECPKGAKEIIRPWGKNGKSKSCLMNHGKFVAWEGGRKILEGSYDNGLEEGTWIWYDEKGNPTKTIDYSKGEKVGETSL